LCRTAAYDPNRTLEGSIWNPNLEAVSGAQEGAAHAVAIGKTAKCGARAPR
jgi:hypothetical protein